jgi:hypothetical protein
MEMSGQLDAPIALPQGKKSQYLFNRGRVGPRARLLFMGGGRRREEKIMVSWWEEKRSLIVLVGVCSGAVG